MLPIQNSINEAVKRRAIAGPPPGLGQLALHIGTRLNMLPRVIRRLRNSAEVVVSAAKVHRPEDVFRSDGTLGYALKIDDDLTYSLLIDIETLLFEMKSCNELITKLLCLVYSHLGIVVPKKHRREAFEKVLSDNGKDTKWLAALATHRNHFIHCAAPYCAIDASNEPWDLMIMRENLDRFDDPAKFLRIADLARIERDFRRAIETVQEHLIGLYRQRRRV